MWPIHSECFPCVNSIISILILPSAYFTDGETEAQSSRVMWSHNQGVVEPDPSRGSHALGLRTALLHCSSTPGFPTALYWEAGRSTPLPRNSPPEVHNHRWPRTTSQGRCPRQEMVLAPNPWAHPLFPKEALPLIGSSFWNPRFVHYPHPRVPPCS